MTETLTADAVREATGRYLRFWNAAQPAEQTFTDDIEYAAPVGVLRGPAALIDFRDQFTSHVGGAELRPVAEPEAHHDRARFSWEIVVKGERFAAGTDVIKIGADGRIEAVTSFLDQAPAGFPLDHH
ncbi:isomerase [Microlunatus speluncae]|uniref:isomerase n=1 Tax=Microlunatus speluncae TaxID=2594267 RepID=UPI0012664A4C|nr:isomerase [Microlunatus speluncae]